MGSPHSPLHHKAFERAKTGKPRVQTPAQTGGRPASPQHLPCMALYCIGVMCSKPGGGTSQYLRTFFFFSWRGERISPPCSSLAPLVKGLLRRRLSREALRWSRLRRSRLRLRRFRSRLRERLWLRFRCRFSLSRSGRRGRGKLREGVTQPTHTGGLAPAPGRPPPGDGTQWRWESKLPGSTSQSRDPGGPRDGSWLPEGTGPENAPGVQDT